MSKRYKYFLSSFMLVVSIGATTPIFSSCASSTIKVETKTYNLDVLTNDTLNKFTSNDIIYAILSNNSNVVDIVLSEIENKIKTSENDTSFSFTNDVRFSSTPKQEYNSSNPTYTNLVLKITDLNTIYDITLQNMFTMSSTNFVPPSNYYYSFDQVNLFAIKDTIYNTISNSAWTAVFNATNTLNYIIPPNIYEVKSKVYKVTTNSQYGGIYTITYGISEDYVQQINTLSNAKLFKDIVVVVNLSPYVGKVLETSFMLDQNAINKTFGEGTTIDSIRNMYELNVYERLKEYVANINTVQPLRDCVSKTDSTKIVGYQVSNSITSPNKLHIYFQTNFDSLDTYTYTFVLEFSN